MFIYPTGGPVEVPSPTRLSVCLLVLCGGSQPLRLLFSLVKECRAARRFPTVFARIPCPFRKVRPMSHGRPHRRRGYRRTWRKAQGLGAVHGREPQDGSGVQDPEHPHSNAVQRPEKRHDRGWSGAEERSRQLY